MHGIYQGKRRVEEDKSRRLKSQQVSVKWLSAPTHSSSSSTRSFSDTAASSTTTSSSSYYTSVEVNGEVIHVGDAIFVTSEQSADYIAKIVYMFECDGEKKFHVHWMLRSSESLLGSVADPRELFITDECSDIPVNSVQRKAKVLYDPNRDEAAKLDDTSFFYQKWYDADLGRIEDVPHYRTGSDNIPDLCGCCERLQNISEFKNARLGQKTGETNVHGVDLYESVKWQGKHYHIGDAVFLTPGSFQFHIKPVECHKTEKLKDMKYVNEVLYPEYYRKYLGYGGVSDKNRSVDDLSYAPPPFQIGYIKEIAQDDDIMLTICKYYRPENTHQGREAAYSADLNMLYWSDEECVVPWSAVRGKANVAYAGTIQQSVEAWSSEGPLRFYFNSAYNAQNRTFSDPPTIAKSVKAADAKDYPKIKHKLKGMDIFAGAGGLTEGLHQSGACEMRYAVEIIEADARAYQLNNPQATVFTGHCNELLNLVRSGQKFDHKGQRLPQKGDIDLLCGAPPCQGFSVLNVHKDKPSSQYNNSLIEWCISFCDYYRPRYFMLENVPNFLSYQNNSLLRTVMRSLLSMGYQCTFGVLQAASYGVPQTRRSAFILAAAPGEVLPYYPEPEHSFLPAAMKLSVFKDNINTLHYT